MEAIGHVIAVSVGQPKTVPYDGGTVRTAIYKTPATGPVFLTRLGFEGDGQADRRVHGGPAAAAYLHPLEHYAHWEPRLGGGPLPHGQFGENLTTEGLTEQNAHVGDVFAVGQARVQVTSPRGPCFKLGIRTGDPHDRQAVPREREARFLPARARGGQRSDRRCDHARGG